MAKTNADRQRDWRERKQARIAELEDQVRALMAEARDGISGENWEHLSQFSPDQLRRLGEGR